MMIAFNQMYRGMGDQGFAIQAGESFVEFCFCVLNAMNVKNCEVVEGLGWGTLSLDCCRKVSECGHDLA